MSDTLQIVLQFDQVGNAPDIIKKMAESTKVISTEEEKYQQKLRKRIDLMQQASRMEQDLIALGAKRAPLTEEEKYQQSLRKTIEALEKKQKIEQDLVRLGHKESESVRKMRQEAEQQKAQAARDSSLRHQGTWLALLAGRPVQAGVTAAMGVGMKANIAMAAIMAGKGAIDTAGEAYGAISNTSLAPQDRDRALFRSVVPGGKWMQEKFDIFSGRAEGIRKLDQETNPQQQVYSQGRVEKYNAQLGLAATQASFMAAAQSTAKLSKDSLWQPMPQDRTTAAGEIEHRNLQRLVPLQDRYAKTIREQTAADLEAISAQKSLTKHQKAFDDQIDKQRRLMEIASDPTKDGVYRVAALQGARMAAEEAEGLAPQVRQATDSVFAAKQRAAQANSAERQAFTGLKQGQVENMMEKEERIRARGERIGSMNVYDRENALNAARMAKKLGRDQTPDHIWQQAMALDPDMFRNMATQAGDRSSQVAAWKKESPGSFGADPETLAEIQRQVVNAKTDIRVDVVMDEKAIAAEIIAGFDSTFGQFLETINLQIDRVTDAKIGKVKTNLSIQNAK